jgi:hypothetical protein
MRWRLAWRQLSTVTLREGGGGSCVSNAAGGISPYSSSCNVIRCIDKVKSNRKTGRYILMACCTQEERFKFMRGSKAVTVDVKTSCSSVLSDGLCVAMLKRDIKDTAAPQNIRKRKTRQALQRGMLPVL